MCIRDSCEGLRNKDKELEGSLREKEKDCGGNLKRKIRAFSRYGEKTALELEISGIEIEISQGEINRDLEKIEINVS